LQQAKISHVATLFLFCFESVHATADSRGELGDARKKCRVGTEWERSAKSKERHCNARPTWRTIRDILRIDVLHICRRYAKEIVSPNQDKIDIAAVMLRPQRTADIL
jgi:hypothetical protein